MHASATFTVSDWTPAEPPTQVGDVPMISTGASAGLAHMVKTFDGDLVGRSITWFLGCLNETTAAGSYAALEAHEDALCDRLLDGLAGIGGVTLHGRPLRRTPTVLFSVEGVPGRSVHEHLATRGVNAPASSFYALEAARHAGLGDEGAVRAGLAPYTSVEDVDRLLAGVAEIAAS